MEKTLGSSGHAALIALIEKKRRAVGLTQTEVAKALGQYQSFVARMESGQRRIDVIEFIALSRILSFDPVAELQNLINQLDGIGSR